jgi:hypothetical protein
MVECVIIHDETRGSSLSRICVRRSRAASLVKMTAVPRSCDHDLTPNSPPMWRRMFRC